MISLMTVKCYGLSVEVCVVLRMVFFTHSYIDGGTPDDRVKKIESMRGLTMTEITAGEGKAIISTITTERAATDPIAAKVLSNMLSTSIK